jgi:cyclopropane fatty-acyl-phospholipid synthase-like methyltransferase
MTNPGSPSRNDPDAPDRGGAGERARLFFDDLWTQGDYWRLETSEFDQARYARSVQLLNDRRYSRALEIGCGAGAFTRFLAGMSDRVVGLDVSTAAIDRARTQVADVSVEFRVANIMETASEEEGPWDLIVMNETVYYLGWLYSFFDVSWLANRLFTATASGGRFMMANTFGEDVGYLQRPAVIRTYRDLFLNAGFRVEHEEVSRGTKDGIQLQVLISLFQRRHQSHHDIS